MMSDEEAEQTLHDVMRQMQDRPRYYRRDGTPYISTPEKPDFLQWAEDYENLTGRRVAEAKTLYGERLSTVFLGMDHSFVFGPHTPILYETMLFAPRSEEMLKDMWSRLRRAAASIMASGYKSLDYEESDEEKRIKKNYPHDNLQLRYATEMEARDKHAILKLQCLIPPRWRRFLLFRIGGDATWE